MKNKARHICKNIYLRTKFMVFIFTPYVFSYACIRLLYKKQFLEMGIKDRSIHLATWNVFLRYRDVSIPRRCILVGVSDPTWIYWKQNCDAEMMQYCGISQVGISLLNPQDWRYFGVVFFSSILKRLGYLSEAEKLNKALVQTNDKRLQAYARREIADIHHLYYMWKHQTKPDFEKGVFMILSHEFETPNKSYEANFTDIDEKEIIENYEAAASFGPTLDIALLDLARFYRNMGKYDQAMKTYEKIKNPCLNKTVEKYRERCQHMLAQQDASIKNKSNNISVLKPVLIGDLDCKAGDIKKVLPETEVEIKYNAAYRNQIKTIQKKLKFSAKHVGIFKNLRRLSHTLTYANDEYLLKDSNHLPESYYKVFSPNLLEYTKKKAIIRTHDDEETTVIEEPVISLGGTNQVNYYHNLFEMLGGLAMIANQNYAPNRKIVFWGKAVPFQQEILNILGVKNEILSLPNNKPASTYKFTNALQLPSAAEEGLPHPAGIHFLREKLSPKPKAIKKGKKIHIIRKSSRVIGKQKRRVFTDHLKENGFELIDTATMSLREQIDYFSDVEVFSADTGAACSNLLFCPQNTKAIIVAPSTHVHEIWSTLAACLDQKLWLCISDPLMHYPNPYFIWNNMVLDIDIQTYHTCLQQAQDG